MEAATAKVTRRQLLGAAAATSLAGTSGCVQRFRSIVNRQSAETVSLSVTAPPADSDRLATLIARHLVSNLEAAGIEATLNILPQSELLREVLLNQNFDLFVARLPPVVDPQEYTALLHSSFAGEQGWQNPYGVTDMLLDDHLDAQQRTDGESRRTNARKLTRHLTRTQPFTTVGFPDEIRAVRTDQFTGWEEGIATPISYLALERASEIPPEEELSLELSITDSRLSQNLNPLSVEYRQPEPFTDLLYDPLVRRFGEEFVPWMASEWAFERDGDQSTITASLRPGLVWHDGTSITAQDVAFTFRFLSDTSLDELEQRVPAPLYRSWTSIVSEARAVDDETIRLTVETPSEAVAKQVLLTPIFPAHIWREYSSVADISGFERSKDITEALVFANENAIGSGPVEVGNVVVDEEVVFQPFEEHFLTRGEGNLAEIPERFAGGFPFDELRFRVTPSNETAVELVAQGDLDGTAMDVDPREAIIERIAGASEVSMVVERSPSAYHIGYNTSTRPFSNPYFCRLVARLVDKQHVVDTIFRGYGAAVSNPFDGTRWSPNDLGFDSADPVVPFLGADGEVDTEQARAEFRKRGFEFDEDGTLLLR
ncbi:MAG: ABC transporter substrate-binding protein [Halovenus sp.]|uniref:ABC transporter substrate-binding protein n=1 Tax=Halovenus amylolytica TaxID=2500550 RepID=UPI000FE43386